MRQTQSRFFARVTEEELQVERTDRNFIFDSKRKKYIDFMMGWCVGNLGWNNVPLKKQIVRFKGPDYVYPGYSYKPWLEFAKLLAKIAPGNLTKCFRATGGSEAVEIALQAALLHTRRRKFLSLEDSYHGNTIGALSIGASETRKKIKNLLPYCYKIEPPLNGRALQKIETRLKKKDIAAFIMEPISINLGILIPDRWFMTELQRLCRKYGTLLIMDEVATGFGRTGTLFASEHFDLEPDILCMGKAITNGLAGMGATITTPEVADSMEEDGSFYSTYGWHPYSVNAAIATIRYIIKNRKSLLENVLKMSDYFRERLNQLQFKSSQTLHIQGLAIGIELDNEDYASRIQEQCRKQGLLISSEGSTLILLPALNINRATAKRGLDILKRCI